MEKFKFGSTWDFNRHNKYSKAHTFFLFVKRQVFPVSLLLFSQGKDFFGIFPKSYRRCRTILSVLVSWVSIYSKTYDLPVAYKKI